MLQVAAVQTLDSTGEVRKADPCVLVWDSETLQEENRLFHGRGYRGVQCSSFSPAGNTLISVCTDNAHTMFVWEWRKGQCLLSRKTRAGAPPTVYGLAWSAFHVDQVVTFGHNHVHFWKLRRNTGTSSTKVLACHKYNAYCKRLSVCIVPKTSVVKGPCTQCFAVRGEAGCRSGSWAVVQGSHPLNI